MYDPNLQPAPPPTDRSLAPIIWTIIAAAAGAALVYFVMNGPPLADQGALDLSQFKPQQVEVGEVPPGPAASKAEATVVEKPIAEEVPPAATVEAVKVPAPVPPAEVKQIESNTAAAAVPEAPVEVKLPEAEVKIAAVPNPVASTPPLQLPKPSFDLVQVDADGAALIAGRAAPDSVVRIMFNDKEIARTAATQAGEFVVLPETFLAKDGGTIKIVTEQDGYAPVESDALQIAPGKSFKAPKS